MVKSLVLAVLLVMTTALRPWRVSAPAPARTDHMRVPCEPSRKRARASLSSTRGRRLVKCMLASGRFTE